MRAKARIAREQDMSIRTALRWMRSADALTSQLDAAASSASFDGCSGLQGPLCLAVEAVQR